MTLAQPGAPLNAGQGAELIGTGDPPFVSVLVPVYNEGRFLQGCLQSLACQDFPADRFEVLILDGGSTDESAGVIRRFCADHPQFHAVPNSARTTASALNLGLRHARGEIIVRLDGHAVAPSDYLTACCRELLRSDEIHHVGGVMRAMGTGYWGESIALGTSSPFGVGNSRHRCSDEDGTEEPGWLGGFRRATLLELGGYDESLGVNEDDDLSYRMQRAGRGFFRTARISLTYYCRETLPQLARQYFRYGRWKVPVIRKHGSLTSVRHLIPSLFVCAVLVPAAAGLVYPPLLFLSVAAGGAYLAVALAGAASVSRSSGWRYFFSLPLVFLTLHASYGTGFLVGLIEALTSGRGAAAPSTPERGP